MSVKDEMPERDTRVEEIWRAYLTTGRAPDFVHQPWHQSPSLKRFVRRVPEDPRCQYCYYPFEGLGGKVARALFGIERSRMNPHMCNDCERFAEEFQGGVEMEVSLLFADVRGSTSLAEKMSAYDFSRLIDRFYHVTTRVIYNHGGMVEKLIGDEVTAFFVPAFAGANHAKTAVTVGREILRDTGHENREGPWIPVGVGVHTGEAFIGTVGRKGSNLDIVVLGDNVNVAARFASVAGVGEMVMSKPVRMAAGLETDKLEHRNLELKGKESLFEAWVFRSRANGG